uniref:Uncharacterized protein n=1 Tax=Meloidogyne javanica TaxID=6303 RepID=A0A915N586_MELJA
MINQLRNLTEQFNTPQKLDINHRKNAETLMRNIQKQNKELAEHQNEREKILKKKENAILAQGRESYRDKIELSKEMHKIAKENNKDWKEFSKEKMSEVQDYLYGNVAEDDVVLHANPVHYRFEGGEPQPFMAEQQMLPQLPPTGFGPITQYTGHPYHQGEQSFNAWLNPHEQGASSAIPDSTVNRSQNVIDISDDEETNEDN